MEKIDEALLKLIQDREFKKKLEERENKVEFLKTVLNSKISKKFC